MLKIGITGGIGSGKSIVSNLLTNMGYPVYNSDFEAKRLCNESEILKSELQNAFGKEIYKDGVLNKTLFASIIFEDTIKLTLANKLIHPVVRKDFLQWTENQKSYLLFIESAILFNSELLHHIDKSITITAPEELRIKRVMDRDGIEKDLVLARIKNQPSEEELLKKTDYIIYNDDKQAIIPQVEKILSLLQ